MNKRVVVTGIGVKTPVGNSVDEFSAALKSGRHGLTLEEWFPGQSEEKNVVGRVKNFDGEKYFDKKELRRTDLSAQYGTAAALDAVADAGGLEAFRETDVYRCGVIVGSGVGGVRTIDEQMRNYHNKSNRKVSVFTVPMMISNMAAGVIAIKTGFRGVNFCPVSACATSTHALGEAFRNIKHGYSDVIIAGGAECSGIGYSFAGFNNAGTLTRSVDPDRASIPFDKERSGFVLGEGAGILILEEYEHAKRRGAKIYGEIAGYGATDDAYHETSPLPDGSSSAMAMKLAVTEAGLNLTDINYINAHGTSTQMNDRIETAAVKQTFGGHANNIVINSTKSLTGHLIGATGAVEAAATLLQMKGGFVHGTAGYKVPDPECDLDYVTNGRRDFRITAAISNSLGFGGHNGSICIVNID
ncbi:3-oxoacyl-[acyl-carrier-protein] synthase 2 [Clostridia bacterium]|nr:3-oxoacyl-[acyl-carrier-protein] synthase 2 [Clostridia bacterium]